MIKAVWSSLGKIMPSNKGGKASMSMLNASTEGSQTFLFLCCLNPAFCSWSVHLCLPFPSQNCQVCYWGKVRNSIGAWSPREKSRWLYIAWLIKMHFLSPNHTATTEYRIPDLKMSSSLEKSLLKKFSRCIHSEIQKQVQVRPAGKLIVKPCIETF